MKKAMIVLLAAALSATMSVPAFAAPANCVNATRCELVGAISAFINDCSTKVYELAPRCDSPVDQLAQLVADGVASSQNSAGADGNVSSTMPYCNVEGCPGYSDANGDGICDRHIDGERLGYSHHGYGQGYGRGHGHGCWR